MNHKKSRNARRNKHRQSGGMPAVVPADINDKTMMSPISQSLAQGTDYNKIHMGQHGGAFVPMSGAPLGDQGLLDSSLRNIARIGPIDASIAAIQGMSDQSGGKRKNSRKSKNSKKASRKSKNSKKASRKYKASRKDKSSRKSKHSRRKQRGGMNNFRPADASASGTILPPSMEDRAVGGMNPEWKLAADPQAFTPKMA